MFSEVSCWKHILLMMIQNPVRVVLVYFAYEHSDSYSCCLVLILLQHGMQDCVQLLVCCMFSLPLLHDFINSVSPKRFGSVCKGTVA